MAYRFATQKEDYTDLSSGHVLYSKPGYPAFPVRLISEIFQRCIALRQRQNSHDPIKLYDPCCGSAYHLAVLGILHRPQLATIIASDIDAVAVNLATRNLSLLTPAGLATRQKSIARDWQQFGKPSHRLALNNVGILAQRMAGYDALPSRCFVADATKPNAIATALTRKVDLVISDVPYGQRSIWQGTAQQDDPIWHLLNELLPVLHFQSIVAIAANKAQKAAHGAYQRNGRFRHGKRMITFLKPISP